MKLAEYVALGPLGARPCPPRPIAPRPSTTTAPAIKALTTTRREGLDAATNHST